MGFGPYGSNESDRGEVRYAQVASYVFRCKVTGSKLCNILHQEPVSRGKQVSKQELEKHEFI